MRRPSSFETAAAAVALAALAGGRLGSAQELAGAGAGAAIAGCAEVGCPNPVKGSTANVCTLQNRTFGDVGVSSLDVADLSWVRGNNLSLTTTGGGGGGGGDRTLTSTFYLGTVPDYDPGRVRACAAFFHQTAAGIGGGGGGGGTCDEAGVGADCVDALRARARALQVEEDDDACAMLEDDFRQNLDAACLGVAGGDGWENVRVRPILGPGAPEPILSSDNLTSNCWPITPKEHDLAFVENYEETTRNTTEAGIDALFYGATPILTVFYDWGVNTSAPGKSFSMSCLKVVNSSVAAQKLLNGDDDEDDDDDDDDNDNDNDDGHDESAATVARVSGVTAAIAAVMAVALGPLFL